ncbi:MAG TPA: hypothetical protein VN643_27655 [Pyrinomonadaceae bacterium]|nr:hypothetical protein [Pyrinomonadaceae bacterium]
MRVSFVVLVILCTLLIGISPDTTASAITPTAKEEYTGTVIGVGGSMGGVSRPFTLTIEDRTSASETSRAIATLAEGGQDALLKELQGKKLGRFSLGGQVGRDLNFVNETRTADGGRRITILFERWMNLFEVRSGARSEDYPFTYIELKLDASGKGEGTFITAARIRFKKNEVEVENFGIYPARLAGVELRN